MKINKIIICLIALLLINSCNSTLICVPSARRVEVRDVFLEKYYLSSHKINTNDRYCVFRQDWNFGLNTNKYDSSIFDKQITQKLKDFGINFKKENFVPSLKNKETEVFLEEISERERKNNYKNCDYIIYYDCATHGNNLCSSRFSITIKVFDIKANKEITQYSFGKDTYQQSKQAEFTELLMNKWWEYQNTPNTKKQTVFECTSDRCRTIKCKGDKKKKKNN